MAFKKSLLLLAVAGVFLVHPMTADASSISLALAGGISSSLDDSSATDEDVEAVVAQTAKENYTGLCIAQVNDYVNVRSEASEEGEIVGKLFNNSVGDVEGSEDGWYLINSGNVHGYVKSEYVVTGDDAEALAEQVGTRVATVTTETLRVRQEATTDSSILGLIPMGEELTVLDEQDGFVKVSIEEGDGWVSTDFVDLRTDYVYAESKEEEEARLAKEKAEREAAQKAAAAAEAKKSKSSKKESSSESVVIGGGSGSAGGSSIASFASQFVGNPYVYGGTSLTNGTDCSGFTQSVLANFGISISRTAASQSGGGTAVDMSNLQPGDLLFYDNGSGIGHVSMYIGNGQVVHASNEQTGIIVSSVDYRTACAARSYF